MSNVIEKLRELIGEGHEGEAWDETHREVDDILDAYKPIEYGVNTVESSIEDYGRWSNYRTEVYQVRQNDGKTAYFSVGLEVPATESQEGGDFSVSIIEVVPKEVVILKYIHGRSA